MGDYRTPLSKARGLGSAKSGVGHFISQRISAIALLVLIPTFIWSVATLPSGDYAAAQAWLGSPWGAIVTLLTLTAALKRAVGHAPSVSLHAIPGLVAGAIPRG